MNNQSSYILFGVRDASIGQARAEIESALGFCFEERESSYQAGLYYIFGAKGSEQFVLKQNLDPFDGEPAEQDFPEYPLILYINSTNRPSELIVSFSTKEKFELLRQEFF